MVIKRGEIWWADLPTARGSEPARRRPVLVVQADDFNRSAIGTILVAAITGNLTRKDAPGNVLVPRKRSGLPRDSVINVSQVLSLDRRFLERRIRALPPDVMHEVDNGLRLVLSLD